MKLSEATKSYFAGIIDGEGSISCGYNNSGLPVLFVAVGMCNSKIPKLLYETYGGSFKKYKNRTAKLKHYWQWIVIGQQCNDVLLDIYPYLRLKQREVKLAFAFIRTIHPRNDRSRLTGKEVKEKCRLADKLREITGRHTERPQITRGPRMPK